MANNVVITGATGFIGAAVMHELVRRGISTTVLLRPESDQTRLAGLSGFERVVCACLDEASLAEKLRERQPKVFIHCAWRGVLGGVRNEAYQISENVPLTIKAVELAHASGCRQWIGLGSQAEYGNLNRRLDESAPTTPTTAYGRAKLAAGIAALGLAETLGLRGAWLRVFSTYGPGDAPQWLIQHVVREFLAGRTPQLTRCEQLWDYLYVADAARAIVSVANGETTGVFNLGSGRAVVLKELIETIRKIIGSTVEPDYGAVPYRPDQVMHLEADIGKLQAATGWFPTTSFEAGLRATVAAVKPG